MRRHRPAAVLIVLLLAAALAVPAGALLADAPAATGHARAGVATVDASWNVGAAQGQYASVDPGPRAGDGVDPYHHSTAKASSEGLHSRITARALVVEGANGERIAIVDNDLYLCQDLLTRRVASLIAEHDRLAGLGLADGPASGITAEALAITCSHSHASPYYSSPSWGVWVFQDVIDLRFFEYMAQRMADAVIAAAADLRPVRMGGITKPFNEISSHSYGPQVAYDGTPAGQPWDHTNGSFTLLRFDDVTDPARPEPYATWLVKGLHPEWSWGDGLVTGDITHAVKRIVDRELGGTLVWSQSETGTAGPHKDLRVHPPEARREFQDMGYAQMDRAARILADAIAEAWEEIATGTAEAGVQHAAFSTDFDVAFISERFAPPAARPYPGVSNCNTDRAVDGDPGVPVVGLPDCGFFLGGIVKPVTEALPVPPRQLYEQLKEAGIPVPESYSGAALTGLQETAAVHLQAFRLGSVGVTFCPCEQYSDQALNIISRLDQIEDNLWLGWDWTEQATPSGRDWCVQDEDSTWTCADPRRPDRDLAPVSDTAYRRMVAQIRHDAAGWETDVSQLLGEAEPADPAAILGNFTHEEHTEHGYDLVVPVGMANDYWGYVTTYREYRANDAYRKALSGLGPRGADYLATRLSRMAASLNGGDPVELSPLDLTYQAESARAQAVADGLGELARAYTTAYAATLPADGGTPEIIEQPDDIRRFDAAHVRFVGGSSWTDLPVVTVERRHGQTWAPYADAQGEVPVRVAFPAQADLPTWRAGQFAWEWTASFEAFHSEIALPDASGTVRHSTPGGEYRFVVEGQHRDLLGDERPYRLESEPFRVRGWDGITVEDLRVEDDGGVSFAIGPVAKHTFDRTHGGGSGSEGVGAVYTVGPVAYPDSYDSPFRQIRLDRRLYTYGVQDPARHQQYCRYCAFRPWADAAAVAEAVVTVVRVDGGVEHITAREVDGRWVADTGLAAGDRAFVASGGITDTYGETNAGPSEEIAR